jgi:tetraacyldisaccharide 4'-kinase
VIVVGNVFVGGTGKTPLVIWLVEQLRARGWHPGVISRGYGAQQDQVTEVNVDSDYQTAGDEPLLIMQRTGVPVVVGRRRVAAGQQLLRAHPDVDIVISDDGLQHYALARTLEIQICDSRGHGNGWLLPAGPLREPASRRSDFFVVNAAAAPFNVTSNAPSNATSQRLPTTDTHRMTLQAEFAERLNQPSQRQPLSTISSGKRIVAAAGIGHPQRFFDMLSKHGIELADTLALPDHFDYRHNPFAQVSADMILITEKDAVKCARINALANDARLWVVPVTATIAEPLIENIVERLHGRSTT